MKEKNVESVISSEASAVARNADSHSADVLGAFATDVLGAFATVLHGSVAMIEPTGENKHWHNHDRYRSLPSLQQKLCSQGLTELIYPVTTTTEARTYA